MSPKAMPPISTLAVKAARRAFESGPWARMSPSERGRIIHRIGDLILEHRTSCAQLESLDNGKPFAVARVADVTLSADMFHYMSGWATKIEGKTIPISAPRGRRASISPSPGPSRSASSARSFPGTSRC